MRLLLLVAVLTDRTTSSRKCAPVAILVSLLACMQWSGLVLLLVASREWQVEWHFFLLNAFMWRATSCVFIFCWLLIIRWHIFGLDSFVYLNPTLVVWIKNVPLMSMQSLFYVDILAVCLFFVSLFFEFLQVLMSSFLTFIILLNLEVPIWLRVICFVFQYRSLSLCLSWPGVSSISSLWWLQPWRLNGWAIRCTKRECILQHYVDLMTLKQSKKLA